MPLMSHSKPQYFGEWNHNVCCFHPILARPLGVAKYPIDIILQIMLNSYLRDIILKIKIHYNDIYIYIYIHTSYVYIYIYSYIFLKLIYIYIYTYWSWSLTLTFILAARMLRYSSPERRCQSRPIPCRGPGPKNLPLKKWGDSSGARPSVHHPKVSLRETLS